MDEHKRRIIEFLLTEICEEKDLDIKEIGDDDPLVESGILDSLGILKLLSFMDEELGIDISAGEVKPSNFANMKTILSLIGTQGA